MASSINSSITNANRVSGLMSGMETEEIIKSMLSPQTARINKQLQARQTLLWRQEAYRTIISAARDFQNKYLDKRSATSIFSTNFLNPMRTALSAGAEKYVSISASANANAGDIVINSITSLASAQKLTSQDKFSAGHTLAMEIDISQLGDPADFIGKSFDIAVDGVVRTITLSNDAGVDYSSIGGIKNEIAVQVDKAFGAGRVNVAVDGDNITFEAGNQGSTVVLLHSDKNKYDQLNGDDEIVKFNHGESSRLNIYTELGSLSGLTFNDDPGLDPSKDYIEFSINGTKFTFKKTNTVNDVITAVNSSSAGVKMSYSSTTDTFTITANAMGAGENIIINEAGDSNLMERLFGSAPHANLGYSGYGIETKGANAEFMLNGVNMVRGSNSFTIDGVTFNLLAATPAGADPITATVAFDTDKAIDNIKSYVNAYNDLMKQLYAAVNERPDRNFFPLSDEQKEKMSDREIEKWEAEAKKGLLYNDSLIMNMIQALRNCMSAPVFDKDGNRLGTFSQIGIQTVSFMDEGGREGRLELN